MEDETPEAQPSLAPTADATPPPTDRFDVEELADGSVRLSRSGTFSKEEWIVGKDLLEVRWQMFFVKRCDRYTGARLEITRSAGGGAVSEHRLGVLYQGKRHELDAAHYADETRRLALYLSEQTGWPLKTID
jgi:hypothetical protein